MEKDCTLDVSRELSEIMKDKEVIGAHFCIIMARINDVLDKCQAAVDRHAEARNYWESSRDIIDKTTPGRREREAKREECHYAEKEYWCQRDMLERKATIERLHREADTCLEGFARSLKMIGEYDQNVRAAAIRVQK